MRLKNSASASKTRNNQLNLDTRGIRRTRRNILWVLLWSSILMMSYACYEVYLIINSNDEYQLELGVICLSLVFILFLIFEWNIIFFHLSKYFFITFLLDFALNGCSVTLSIFLSLSNISDQIDMPFLVPLCTIVLIEILFILRLFLFYHGIYTKLHSADNNASAAYNNSAYKYRRTSLPYDSPEEHHPTDSFYDTDSGQQSLIVRGSSMQNKQ